MIDVPPAIAATGSDRHSQSILEGTAFSGRIDTGAWVVVAGDVNEFQFGEPLRILERVGLTNLMETLPAGKRYISVFEGNAQAIDHLLVSPALGEQLVSDGFDIVHVNAEYREQASGHDPQLARFRLPAI